MNFFILDGHFVTTLHGLYSSLYDDSNQETKTETDQQTLIEYCDRIKGNRETTDSETFWVCVDANRHYARMRIEGGEFNSDVDIVYFSSFNEQLQQICKSERFGINVTINQLTSITHSLLLSCRNETSPSFRLFYMLSRKTTEQTQPKWIAGSDREFYNPEYCLSVKLTSILCHTKNIVQHNLLCLEPENMSGSEQIETKLTLPGDSGSLLVAYDTKNNRFIPIGMHFGIRKSENTKLHQMLALPLAPALEYLYQSLGLEAKNVEKKPLPYFTFALQVLKQT
jgi:hypothetical protein